MTTRSPLEGLNRQDPTVTADDLQMDEFSLVELEDLQDEAAVSWRTAPNPADAADYREIYLHLGAAIYALKRTFARTSD